VEVVVKLGAAAPHLGADASPEGLLGFAARAEELGLDSLWVLERLMRVVPDEGEPFIPAYYGSVYSPLETLAFLAGRTSTITLGASVLDALFHAPVALARQLATLDHLSGGRLVVGLGQGWSPEEFAAVDVPMCRCADEPTGQGFRGLPRRVAGGLAAGPGALRGALLHVRAVRGQPEAASGRRPAAAARGDARRRGLGGTGRPVGKELSAMPEIAFAAGISGTHNMHAAVSSRSLDELFGFVTDRIGALDGVRAVEVSPVLRQLKQFNTLMAGQRLAPVRSKPAPAWRRG